MAINSVGQFQEMVNNYRANDWVGNNGQFDKVFEGIGEKLEAPGVENKNSFAEILTNQISDVNSLQKDADVAIQKLVTGRSQNIHETMLAVEKAEIAFKQMNQIRLKVIDAYKEVMRMQI